jgi:hypothetical protein
MKVVWPPAAVDFHSKFHENLSVQKLLGGTDTATVEHMHLWT